MLRETGGQWGQGSWEGHLVPGAPATGSLCLILGGERAKHLKEPKLRERVAPCQAQVTPGPSAFLPTAISLP